MSEVRLARNKRPLKLLVDTPFVDAPVAAVTAAEGEEVVQELSKRAKEDKKAVVCGVNAVARVLQQLGLVVVCGEGAPLILTQHLREGCQAALCRLVSVPVTAEAMGKALGVKRALAVGLRKEQNATGTVLERVGVVPSVPWLQPGPVKYLPLHICTTESKATPEQYEKRHKRKTDFAEKQRLLKQRREEAKRVQQAEERRLKKQKQQPQGQGRGKRPANSK